MILHKLASAIRRQDWFQVVIEVLIVIVGIFLGLQVQSWYEDQANRADEQRYLTRLHLEVTEALRPAYGLMRLRQERHQELREVMVKLDRDNPDDEISNRQCYAILASYLYVSSAASLPTMNELMATGKLDIITSEEVRNAISLYDIGLAMLEALKEGTQRNVGPFTAEHVEFFETDLSMDKVPLTNEDIDRYDLVCKLDMMRESLSFKNEMTRRFAGLGSYIDLYHTREIGLLEALRHALEAELGMSSMEEGAT